MIISPLETQVMRGKPVDAISKTLLRALSANITKPLMNSQGLVQAVIDGEEVPAFTTPIRAVDAMGRVRYFVDLRKSRREYEYNEISGQFKPLPLSDANFTVNLALIEQVWSVYPGALNSVYYDACRVYAFWMATRITAKLVLSPQQTNELLCYFAYYWLNSSKRVATLSEMEYDDTVNIICRIFGFQAPEVYTYLDPFNKVVHANIDALCLDIAKVNGSPKLAKFNRIVLQTMLLGSWFGGNANEISSIATEYPPYFIIMLYRALGERTFKDTIIAKLATRFLNSGKQKQYLLIVGDALNRAATE